MPLLLIIRKKIQILEFVVFYYHSRIKNTITLGIDIIEIYDENICYAISREDSKCVLLRRLFKPLYDCFNDNILIKISFTRI